ncbi:DUF2911 domain-containing protein [Neolewinella aurantiaca]|uniref:DUF2911 domain-containing protein n=1 Tax=Neolewinella aurantiaca TaxID=2602767 RepID=A0A5C7FA25_9BACT|nr:DUF6503 family protein [Neolewinella aurantiaca]TXF86258.1 DUF2911 domain-containing protein [Neolewinella aurantiaca]
MYRLIILLAFFPMFLGAQFVAPKASPPATTTIDAGYTQLSVKYNRPNVRQREIFGKLLPWGEIWRAGANENTVLSLDGDAEIDGKPVPAGDYSLLIIPDRNGSWTWVLNRDVNHWGARGYKKERDLLRIDAAPRRLPERIETLEFRWMNVNAQGADLVMEWEWYRLRLHISLPTELQVSDRAAVELNPAKDPKEYYEIARYYLDNGSARKAKAWIDRWAAADEEQFGRSRYHAIIEYKNGNEAKALRLMNRSLALAEEAGNEHYIRMNKQSLREWTRKPHQLSADSVLTRSLRFHDPEGNWGKQSHLIQLAESRPNGTVRHTRLSLFPLTDEFDMQQVRGKDKLQMRYLKGTFGYSVNGDTEADSSTINRLGLTPKRMLAMRDYYTYLYGLPMKLRDKGTIIDPEIHEVWFHGKTLLEMKVTYAPETGKDSWFFYFDPQDYSLSGYAFYHDIDGPGTGEYILLEGEAEIDKMILPAKRHWYLTSERLYLGTDEILN